MTDPNLLEWIMDDKAEASEHPSKIAEISPSQALIDRTLSLVDAEWEASSRRNWRYTGVGIALAAGLMLAVSLPSNETSHSPIEHMTPKGLASTAPEIGLKMAVSSQGQLARVAQGARYQDGDQLFFRISSTQAGWVYLVHESEKQAQLLTAQQVPAGETDLGGTTNVLSWTIERGDPAATFIIIGSLEPIETNTLLDALQDTSDPGNTPNGQRACTMARSMGWSCDTQAVEASP